MVISSTTNSVERVRTLAHKTEVINLKPSIIGFNKSFQTPISAARLSSSKRAFAARRAHLSECESIVCGAIKPQAGDLVLATILSIGQHQRIELASGRRSHLFVGDEIIVCYANRYAPDQFEALVPDSLDDCHLIAAGGVASLMSEKHSSLKEPTAIRPVGLLADKNGEILNIKKWALTGVLSPSKKRPYIIAVLGTAMNAGKTTIAAHLLRGLSKSGLQVSAFKSTGTGSGGDLWLLKDAGAISVYDFSDAGYASTYKIPVQELEDIFSILLHNSCEKTDVIIVEIADGLLQKETKELIASKIFHDNVDKIIFAASDSMGATAGVKYLQECGHSVAALSGSMTASPLLSREAALATKLPVLSKEDLLNSEYIRKVIFPH